MPLPDRIELRENAELPVGVPGRSFDAWIVHLDENEVLVELSRYRGITSRVRIGRELISKIERGDPAERPFAELAPFLTPPPDAADADAHQAIVTTRLLPFLNQFGDAPQADLVREARDLYQAELKRLGAGEVKIHNRWFSQADLDPIDHETLTLLREVPRAAHEPISAFVQRVKAAVRLSPSEFFPELARALDETARRRITGASQVEAQRALSSARLRASLSTREAMLVAQIEAIVNEEPMGGVAVRPVSVADRIFNENTGKWFKQTEVNTSLFTEFMIPDGRPKRALSQTDIKQVRGLIDELAIVRQASQETPVATGEVGPGKELAAMEPLRRLDLSAFEESVQTVQQVQDQVRKGLESVTPDLLERLAASVKKVPGGTAHLRLAGEMPLRAAGLTNHELKDFVAKTELALNISALAHESLRGSFRDTAKTIPTAWQSFLNQTAGPRFLAAADQMPPQEWADSVASFVDTLFKHRSVLAQDAGKEWALNLLNQLKEEAIQETASGDADRALIRVAAASSLLAKPNLISSHEKTRHLTNLENIRRRILSRLWEAEGPAFQARLQELASSHQFALLHETLQQRWRNIEKENPDSSDRRLFGDLALKHAAAALKAFAPLECYYLVDLARTIDPDHGQIKLWISGAAVGLFAIFLVLGLIAFALLSQIVTHFDNLRFKFRVGVLRKPKRKVLPKS
ncbi:MAG: hypothetical protein OHK005_21140 [Candidatus Methylacidiphilales bacterium]